MPCGGRAPVSRSWSGVTCDKDGNVLGIRLVCYQPPCLRGPLPQGLARLPRLRQLDLYNNNFTGQLPAEGWGAESGAFPSLEVLRLSFNELEGSLPAEWGEGGAFPRLKCERTVMPSCCPAPLSYRQAQGRL